MGSIDLVEKAGAMSLKLQALQTEIQLLLEDNKTDKELWEYTEHFQQALHDASDGLERIHWLGVEREGDA